MSTFIVAELSANHGGLYPQGIENIDYIAEVGADAVKTQTYTPDDLTIDCDNKYFTIKNKLWKNHGNLYGLYTDGQTPYYWQDGFKKRAEDNNLIFFSTPFSKKGVDYLEKLNVPMYKIASFEANDTEFVKYVADKGKPMIVSTGMIDESGIEDVVKICKDVDLTLLKCTSSYPTPLSKVNLLTMEDMRKFGVKVGLSDHTKGSSAALAAVALGASVIEKHFTTCYANCTIDTNFSLDYYEFKEMVQKIREIEQVLGDIDYTPTGDKQFKRSLFVVRDVKKGEKFTRRNIRSIRPGYGLPPKMITEILGNYATQNLKVGTPLKKSHVTKKRI